MVDITNGVEAYDVSIAWALFILAFSFIGKGRGWERGRGKAHRHVG